MKNKEELPVVHVLGEGDEILCGKSREAALDDQELAIHRHYVEERKGKVEPDHGEMCEHCLNAFNGTTIYPEITVELDSRDGDAFSILGKATREFKSAGLHPSVRDAFRDEAMAGSYDHLIQTLFKWVDVDFVGEEEEEDDEDDWDDEEEDEEDDE